MTQEAMERELIVLKKKVLEKKPEEQPPPGYMLFGQPPVKTRPRDQAEIVSNSASNKARRGYNQPPSQLKGDRYFGARHFTLRYGNTHTSKNHRQADNAPVLREQAQNPTQTERGLDKKKFYISESPPRRRVHD